jgi:2-keto-4-pentenoate hydratase/2-oxohepta-3-ene-1,7-dioic acid hydratase in catechol pathway
MRICRFTLKGDAAKTPRVGLLGDDGVRDVTAVTDTLPPQRWPQPPGDQFIANLDQLRPKLEATAAKASVIPRSSVHLMSPVANPSKFVCGVGNWPHHQAPFGMLGFLFKMTSAMAGEDDGVQIRWPDRTTYHEAELGWVIGRTCVNVSEADALKYVAGYTCALDMTLKQDKECFTFCKSFDTYGVLGPSLVTADEVPDPSKLTYRFLVNDELQQPAASAS